jgi:sugar lactone lactonase YvrE
MIKRIAMGIGLLLAAAVAYLSAWPVPVEPRAWTSSPAPGYAGPHAVNTRLAGLKYLELGGEEGPEHVVLRDGWLYTTVAGGKILRLKPDGSGLETYAATGGRVLGFDFDAGGNLIAADAMRGLVMVSAADRKVSVLADTHAGQPIRYADAVVVAAGTGRIYFSDASTRFGPKDWGGTYEASILDIIEQACTGRILEYDPASKATRVVAQGMSFANGVALSRDERSLFVTETGKYRIWKIDVTADALDVGDAGPKARPAGPSPQARLLFDNLPGYPDNLLRGQDNRIWVGFAGPRSPNVDQMADKPFLRKLTLRLPRWTWPLPKPYGHVMAFDEDGKVLADLQDPSGAYPQTTGVTETADRLYIQNLHARRLGWMPRP